MQISTSNLAGCHISNALMSPYAAPVRIPRQRSINQPAGTASNAGSALSVPPAIGSNLNKELRPGFEKLNYKDQKWYNVYVMYANRS